MKLDTIVAATDFSALSMAAVQTATSLARQSGSKLYLVYVLDLPLVVDPMGAVPDPDPQEMREVALGRLKDLIARPEGDGQTEVVVLEGPPARAIADFASKQQADMIVVGTHGRSGLDRLLVGSTAEGLLRQAPCPVLVVKHHPREGSD